MYERHKCVKTIKLLDEKIGETFQDFGWDRTS